MNYDISIIPIKFSPIALFCKIVTNKTVFNIILLYIYNLYIFINIENWIQQMVFIFFNFFFLRNLFNFIFYNRFQ